MVPDSNAMTVAGVRACAAVLTRSLGRIQIRGMPGSSRPREITRLTDRETIAAFLNAVTGVYTLSRSERRWGVVARTFGAGIGIPIITSAALDITLFTSFAYRAGVYTAAIALLGCCVLEGIDFVTASVQISPVGMLKTSRIPAFAFSIGTDKIAHIALSEKGGAFYVSVGSFNRFDHTFALPADAKQALLAAAHTPSESSNVSPAAQIVRRIVGSCAIGAAVGFVGAIVAIPLYTEASHLVGISTGIMAAGLAPLLSERITGAASLPESRGRRIMSAALSVLCCVFVLLFLAWSSSAGA